MLAVTRLSIITCFERNGILGAIRFPDFLNGATVQQLFNFVNLIAANELWLKRILPLAVTEFSIYGRRVGFGNLQRLSFGLRKCRVHSSAP